MYTYLDDLDIIPLVKDKEKCNKVFCALSCYALEHDFSSFFRYRRVPGEDNNFAPDHMCQVIFPVLEGTPYADENFTLEPAALLPASEYYFCGLKGAIWYLLHHDSLTKEMFENHTLSLIISSLNQCMPYFRDHIKDQAIQVLEKLIKLNNE